MVQTKNFFLRFIHFILKMCHTKDESYYCHQISNSMSLVLGTYMYKHIRYRKKNITFNVVHRSYTVHHHTLCTISNGKHRNKIQEEITIMKRKNKQKKIKTNKKNQYVSHGLSMRLVLLLPLDRLGVASTSLLSLDFLG